MFDENKINFEINKPEVRYGINVNRNKFKISPV